MNSISKIVFAAALLSAILVLILRHGVLQQAQTENRQLKETVSRSQPEVEPQLAPVSSTRPSLATQSTNNAEIEELRSLVASQRAGLSELRTALSNISAPSNLAGLQQNFTSTYVPRNLWHGARFDTPEAAVESALAAALNGDVAAMRSSLTSNGLVLVLQRQWKDKTSEAISQACAAALSNASGFEILNGRSNSSDSIRYTMYIDGVAHSNQPLWMGVTKTGNEWKCDEFVVKAQ